MTVVLPYLRAAIVIAALLLPQAASAKTPISKESANAYFAKCIQSRDQRMRQETQEELCACTSVQMMQSMSVEDVKIMGQNTPAGREMLNYMLINVYGPCMSGPVQDLVDGQCDNDPRIALADQLVDRRALCGCMAERTGKWFESDGMRIMEQVLKQQPYTADPITPVMESDVFQDTTYNFMLGCATTLQQDGNKRR